MLMALRAYRYYRESRWEVWGSGNHATSSRAKPSIFLAHRYSVLCEIAEKGKPFAKGARKNKVQGRFLAALEMTVWGDGFISCSVQRICLESAIPVSSSRAKPSIFLAYRYSVLCETAEKGKIFAKGARKSRVQGRFLAALEMTVGKAADSMNLRF